MPAQTSVKSEMNTVQYHPLCPNIVTAVLLLYILWTGFSPLTYACQCVKSLLYTVKYHMLCFKTYLLLLFCRHVFPLPTFVRTLFEPFYGNDNRKRNSLYVRCMENHIKTSMLIVEKKGML